LPIIRGKALAVNIEYEAPTWNQIYDMLLSQTQKIQNQDYKPDIIIAIAKGGLIPARILTDLLEIQELGYIQIEFYKDINITQQEPTLKQNQTNHVLGKKTLLVDDIADTGRSLNLAKIHLQQQGANQIKTATLYQKSQSSITPDFCEKQTTSWVVFPWETKETLRKIIQRQHGKRSLNHEVAKLVKAGLPKQLTEKLLKAMQ
jgi:hypoxanthine phosphoribosyltransferase